MSKYRRASVVSNDRVINNVCIDDLSKNNVLINGLAINNLTIKQLEIKYLETEHLAIDHCIHASAVQVRFCLAFDLLGIFGSTLTHMFNNDQGYSV